MFLTLPLENLNSSDFVAGICGAFSPEAALYIPAAGNYTGVESTAEYVLVTDAVFDNGAYAEMSYVIDPDLLFVDENWIQASH